MKSKFAGSKKLLVLIVAILTLAVACSGGVKGNTYADNGNVVQIEFKSGGKAYMSMGPMTNTCNYMESGKNVTLKNSVIIGADRYDSPRERQENERRGMPNGARRAVGRNRVARAV